MRIAAWTARAWMYLAAVVILTSCSKPPTGRMQQTADLRTVSIFAGGERWAAPEFQAAESLRAAAEAEMDHQRRRLLLFRDYELTDSLFRLAGGMYERTTASARDSINATCAEAVQQLEFLERELSAWRAHLDTNLVMHHLEALWHSAQASHDQGMALSTNSNCHEALDLIRESRATLDSLAELLLEYRQNESALYKEWSEWIRLTLAESAIKQKPAIIVDKSAHLAYLARRGEIVRSFPCELGYRPARQKLFAGDGATPEGRYKVKAINNQSKYYRAMVLEYPNDDDRRRFRLNREQGVIPDGRGIGSMIELHGHGGQGRDWTDGCVALTDSDLDTLLQSIGVGTPVTIVRRWPGAESR